jgi:hypothetical protein
MIPDEEELEAEEGNFAREESMLSRQQSKRASSSSLPLSAFSSSYAAETAFPRQPAASVRVHGEWRVCERWIGRVCVCV